MIGTWLIVLIVLTFAFRLVLSILNYRHRHRPVPEVASGIYDDEAYQKWLSYFMENFRFSLFHKSVDLVLIIVLLVTHAFGFLERLTDGWFANPIPATLSFLGLYVFFRLVVGLPFSYYETFVIEEKYGFNRQTRKGFVTDLIKQLVLIVVLGGGVISLLMFLYLRFASMFLLYGWIGLTVILFLIFILNTKVFVRMFNKLTPLEDGELKDAIVSFVEKSGYQIKAISTMDASKRSTKVNAFFSGFGKFKEIVLFDTLVDKLTTDEIIAVLAHEIAHGKFKDAWRMIFQQVLILGLYVAIIGFTVSSDALAQAFGLSGAHFGFGLLLFFILIEPIGLILSILTNHLSRVAEYRADRYAASMGYKDAMQNAFCKLARENFAQLTPHPLYVFFYYSHPAIPDRLEAITAVSDA